MPTLGEDLRDELETERRHLTDARTALADMRTRAHRLYGMGELAIGDTYSAERLGVTLRRRMVELADVPDAPLFFGRLDLDPTDAVTAVDVEEDGTRHYVGRRHVVDARGIPLVLDWRAPLSRTFYRAGAADPQGVVVRRRFGFQGGELTSFEDEHLSRGDELGRGSRILTEEIERPRVGPMRDIVATIQPDQDELVRADLDTSICVQGAPGTGKTAVGLHRAAFLLYAHRDRLRRSRVLVVGPSRALLAYIGQVLPALGELDVEQAGLDDLVARFPVRASDTPVAERLKHDERMAEVLRRALAARVGARPPSAWPVVEVPDGSHRWRLDRTAQGEILDRVRAEEPVHALGRERLSARLVAAVARRAEATTGAATSEAWSRRVARNASLRAFVDEVWPAMTPEGLVAGLLGDPGALAAASEGVLTAAERDALAWARPPRSPRAARWSRADLWLIDEAAGLITREQGYGHVVVDEAQDLSPLQARALARRSAHGSVTVLGDLAQGTSPWAARTWRETLTRLGKPDAVVVPLTTGFRVPRVVMEFANLLLPRLDVDVPAAGSLRADGTLDVVPVAGPAEALVEALVDAARAALGFEGSVGIVVPDSRVGALSGALTAAGLDHARPDDDRVTQPGAVRITLVPAGEAKGLEYDHVVVVEPAMIVREEPRGLHRLYVVLTRAVSRLVVLHAEPLPDPLRAPDLAPAGAA